MGLIKRVAARGKNLFIRICGITARSVVCHLVLLPQKNLAVAMLPQCGGKPRRNIVALSQSPQIHGHL